jgi:signal transduction histidine kinase
MKLSKIISSSNIKFGLLFFAIVIAIGTLYYSQNLITRLQARERQVVELFADGIRYIATSEATQDYSFIYNNIVARIDFPLILTSSKDSVTSYRNVELDSLLTQDQKNKIVQSRLKYYSRIHAPILVEVNGMLLQKIYYGESVYIEQLRYYPYLQIFIAFLFLLVAYTSFNYLKKSEQSNIWVGMSKETAHQLGTPISSLMGWNEILKMNYQNPDKVIDASQEIDSDLNRLNKIINRFSKIGSKPELKKENLHEVILRVVTYFGKRLPHSGKLIQITLEGNNEIITNLNAELFEWVIENLIKNALDAIETKEGFVKVSIFETAKNIEIEVSDNGKGIDYKLRNEVFKPGFSTKRRGWGLGLSLSKRIVEDYHKGKIYVKDSVQNHGTTFKIILKK